MKRLSSRGSRVLQDAEPAGSLDPGSLDPGSSSEDSADEADGAPADAAEETAASDSDNENPPLRGSMLVPAKPLMQGRPTMPSAPASCSLDPALRAPAEVEGGADVEAARGPGDFPDLPEHWPPPSLHGDYVVYMFEGPAPDMLPEVAAPPSSLLPLALPAAEFAPSGQALLPAPTPPVPRDERMSGRRNHAANSSVRDLQRVGERAPLRPGHERQKDSESAAVQPPSVGGWLRTTPPLNLSRRRPPAEQPSPGAERPGPPADAAAKDTAAVASAAPANAPDAPQGAAVAPAASLAVQMPRRDATNAPQPASQAAADSKATAAAGAVTRTAPGEAHAKKGASKGPEEGREGQPARKRHVGVAAEGLIHPFHIALFATLLLCCLVAAIMLMHYTTEMGWMWSGIKVLRKLAKGLAFRQTVGLLAAMAFVRWGLEPLVRTVRALFRLPGDWERSSEFFFLRQARLCRPTCLS